MKLTNVTIYYYPRKQANWNDTWEKWSKSKVHIFFYSYNNKIEVYNKDLKHPKKKTKQLTISNYKSFPQNLAEINIFKNVPMRNISFKVWINLRRGTMLSKDIILIWYALEKDIQILPLHLIRNSVFFFGDIL